MLDTVISTVMVTIIVTLICERLEAAHLPLRSVTKAIVSFSSIVLLEYNTVDSSKGFSAPIQQILSRYMWNCCITIYHVMLIEKVRFQALRCAFDLKLTSDYICCFVQILFKLSLTLIFSRDWEGKTGIWAYDPWLSKVMGHF